MKKALAVLMLAAMMLSVGCGNQAQETAKDAQQKVEQKADEAKDKAQEVKDDAAKKADEVKEAANQAAEEVKQDAEKIADEAVEKLEEVTADVTEAVKGRNIALSGIMPGASLDDLKAMFGEPTATDGDILTFVDGLKVTLDNAKKTVKSVSATGANFDTPEGMYVGAYEYSLNEYCGPADSVRKIDNGAEYEYDSGDKKSKVVYKAQNGFITEITCSLK